MKLWATLVGVVVVLLGAIVISSEGSLLARLSVLMQRPDGPSIVMQVEPDGMELDQTVEQSIRAIERRLYELGTRGAIERQGADQVLVRLSRSADLKHSIEVMTRRGKLEFRLVDFTEPVEQVQRRPPRGWEVLYGSGDRRSYLVEKRVLVSGRDVVDAQPGFDTRTSEPIVSFRFNANGARQFAQVTQENVGKPFAIVLDNDVITAPTIREPILAGRGQISGSFTVQSANDLAVLLRAGELPGRLTVIEQRMP